MKSPRAECNTGALKYCKSSLGCRSQLSLVYRYTLRWGCADQDALQIHGLNEAIVRLRASVTAGADVLFLEGINTAEQAG